MRHTSVAAILVLSLIGCSHTPPPVAEKTVPVSNSTYTVEQLFVDPDGSTLYRFYDQGDWRYYAFNPGKGVAQMLPTTHYIVKTETVTETQYVESKSGRHHGGGKRRD